MNAVGEPTEASGEARPPTFHVVLFRPEIPQNTGNIGRLCAITGARLHLIHPLGFTITDRHLRRSGMDYWRALDLHEHADWAGFRAHPASPARLWLFTTRAETSYWDVRYETGDGLLFGNEGAGCPDWLHQEVGDGARVKIPQPRPGLRSLNLSTAAGIAAYEVLRQLRVR
ncbi:MAG: tRNA (cytidine(34)-2'-O)-methyltransferase [Puniceicoccaceae bacterium]|nr:MAG: tRNA (cytidine(34)-2'-O)-methyltransferase [Puniceicoccaceae bacterium]